MYFKSRNLRLVSSGGGVYSLNGKLQRPLIAVVYVGARTEILAMQRGTRLLSSR